MKRAKSRARETGRGALLLSDGNYWRGQGVGDAFTQVGEFVFHTGYTGYQEVLTDPSYCKQVLVFSSPQIGNQGFHQEDFESDRIWASGCVMREFQEDAKHWRFQKSLLELASAQKVPVLTQVDTRSLTHHLRDQGALWGVISTESDDRAFLEEKLRKSMGSMEGLSLTAEVSSREKKLWTVSSCALLKEQRDGVTYSGKTSPRVVVLDLGVKRQILRCLKDAGFGEIVVLPRGSGAEEILALKPDGVLISNGPGDPAAELEAIACAKALLGKVPLFGICLGHQILGIALGLKTYKLRFGHHAANHPVMNLRSGSVEITSQNHGFAVELSAEHSEIEPTHIHLNDRTLAGFRHTRFPVMAIQFHPEASPGPLDSRHSFVEFREVCGA